MAQKSVTKKGRVSASVTAADVNRFRNPEALKASNPLIDDDIGQTLHRVACVVAFLSECLQADESVDDDQAHGHYLVMLCMRDALEKQAAAIQGASHGE